MSRVSETSRWPLVLQHPRADIFRFFFHSVFHWFRLRGFSAFWFSGARGGPVVKFIDPNPMKAGSSNPAWVEHA